MKNIVLVLLLFACALKINAQKKGDPYRRNSLCVFFITDVGRLDRTAISYIDYACQNYHLSSKFDSHDLGVDRTIQVNNIELKGKNKPKESWFNKFTSTIAIASGQEEELAKIEEEENNSLKLLPNKLMQYIEDNKIANLLIAKWFNASTEKKDGSYYDMSLIQERGIYSASELDRLRAKESVRGEAILADAGMELLSHTFVTFTFFNYTESQEVAKKTGEIMSKIVGKDTYLGRINNKTTNDFVENESGYYVSARTYLFRLKWDEKTEELFIAKYYNEPVSTLLDSDDFEMEYVGEQFAKVSFIERTGEGKVGNIKMASEATIKAIDKSLYNLQTKFEDFRIKAPLIDVNKTEITAFVGTKEGITPKSNFQVLERNYNEKKNKFDYKKVATLKIDNNHPIFDNEYVYGQEEEPFGKTYFKGDYSKLAPGMLIRQTN